jgi:predicted amidohydrolase YtcJ
MGKDRFLAGENKWALSRQDLDWRGAGTEYETIILANRYGWSIMGIHTQGDIGAKMMLEAYEKADKERPLKGRAFGFDHGMIRTDEDLQRAVKLDVRNSFNSNYVFGPNNRGQIYMFGEHLATFSPVRSAVDFGVQPGLEMEGQFQESGKVAAFVGIQRFVTRMDDNGRPWGVRQAITREDGLRMATIWNARYTAEDDILGSIEEGKLGDMVVLAGDYMTVTIDKIRDLQLDYTILGGKVVYDRVKDGPVKRGPRAAEGN